jgi:uncharacterized membrane protein (UPF0136 family)
VIFHSYVKLPQGTKVCAFFEIASENFQMARTWGIPFLDKATILLLHNVAISHSFY